jgi:transposase
MSCLLELVAGIVYSFTHEWFLILRKTSLNMCVYMCADWTYICVVTSCGSKLVRLSNLDRAPALCMAQGGTSQDNVARHFNVNNNTISRLVLRYRDTSKVKDRARSGRPRVSLANTDRRIVGLTARRRCVTVSAIQAEIQNPGQQIISDQTIRNRLHSGGFRSRRAKIVLAMTPNHQRRRLRWCQQHCRWTMDNWQRVLFSEFA